MTALPAGGDGSGVDALAELDHRDKAVAVGPVPFLGARFLRCAERGERAPFVRCKPDRDARRLVVEAGVDCGIDALEAIDVTPRHAPAAKVCLETRQPAREGVQL